MEQFSKNRINPITLSVKKDDIILIRYNASEVPHCEMFSVGEYFKKEFPNNKVIILPEAISFSAEDAQKMVEILETTIQDVKEHFKKE